MSGGLSKLTGDSGSSNSRGKSTHIKFYNPSTAEDDITEGSEERHKQDYYDAAKEMRNRLNQDINIPVGEFLVALRDAEVNNDYEAGQELANTLFNPEADE